MQNPKGALLSEVGPLLKKQGFQVINIDFTNMLDSHGYNPLDYIRYDKERQKYSEQDIVTIATCLVPIEDPYQPAWELHASIQGIIAQKLDLLTFGGPLQMYSRPDKVDFAALGREKTAVFLNVSDTDRSMDRLVNLFYTQALQALCNSADKEYPDHRLPVPVRFILDDFAANAEISGFDKMISVIRSREIYVSIILHSHERYHELPEAAREDPANGVDLGHAL